MKESTPKKEDVFTLSKKNIRSFFNEIEKTSPEINQSLTKLQQNYIYAWKTLINSAISLEQEYVTKSGFMIDVPESVLQTIHDLTEASIQAYLQQNKLTINSAEASKQIFSIFNENTQSFTRLNEEIMGYLMSVFKQK